MTSRFISAVTSLFAGPKMRKQKPHLFVSWYQPPLRDYREYLCRDPDGDGYYYSRDKDLAHRFDNHDKALKVTPIYDGSANIEKRTGIIQVR